MAYVRVHRRYGRGIQAKNTKRAQICVVGFLTWCFSIQVMGCGNSARECQLITELDVGDGLLSTPDELDQAACTDGAFVDFDPLGTWALYYLGEGGEETYSRTVRFSPSCEGLEVFGSAGQFEHRAFDEDRIFWWSGSTNDLVASFDAGLLCSSDTDGSLRGVHAFCDAFGEQEPICVSRPIVARRAGWPVGEVEAEGVELVAELYSNSWPRTLTTDVAVHDGVAYLSRSGDGIRVIDVSNPSHLREVGHVLGDGESINEAKVVRTSTGEPYLLAASDTSGFVVMNLSEPHSPEVVARFHPFGAPVWPVHTVHTELWGDTLYAYLSDSTSENVFVLDITDPENPVEVGVAALGDDTIQGTHAVFPADGRAYICAGYSGFIVADLLPSPGKAEALGVLDTSGYAHQAWVGRAGGRLIAAFGNEGSGEPLRIIDVDPASPQFMLQIGEAPIRAEASIHDMVLIDEVVYSTAYENGVRIFDVSDPTNPIQTAYFNTWDISTGEGPRAGGALGLHVDADEGLIYVADNQRGMMVLRITSPLFEPSA